MILVAVFGGLGNQMFQYACARALQEILHTEVKLDLTLVNDRSPRKDFTYREFELDVFSIQLNIASKSEVRRFVPNLWAHTPKLYKSLFALKRKIYHRCLYLEKNGYIFDDKVLNVCDDTYLVGYFQSEKYFIKYRNKILNDFRLKCKLSELSESVYKKIVKEKVTCSIHVRRGDYASNLKVRGFHGLCDLSYYRNAVEFMKQKYGDITFFVFSDDSGWLKTNFIVSSNKVIIVENNKARPNFEDLILMSKCNHQIIANSSFSWWAAWLNENKFKTVIAPKQWLKNPSDNALVKDLIPSTWIRL